MSKAYDNSKKEMKIIMVISSLNCGGAERVMSNMANYWADKDWQVILLTMDNGKEPPFYSLHPKINWIPLGVENNSFNLIQGALNNIKKIKVLRSAIKDNKPEAVISFMDRTNVLTIFACLGLNAQVVVSEHIDPSQHNPGRIWGALRRVVYQYAQAVVVLTDVMGIWFKSFLREDLIHTIPNSVSILDSSSDDIDKNYIFTVLSDFKIAAMGRLDPQKGFDLLLLAFAQCIARHPDSILIILGEGNERQSLEELAKNLGIENKTFMPGNVKNPGEILRQVDLFVVSSRYEGFCNVLCEAMALGLPVISTDCPSGPGEIIRDGVDGVLVTPNDVGALAAAMERLMSDEAERKRLGNIAVDVTERYSLEKVMGMWEALLK
jgi:glycosyltransferase involved in cell wall biosynthesis